MQLSLQMYTVRKEAQRDLLTTLQKVKKIGYEAVEAARLPLNDKTAQAFIQIKELNGLSVTSHQLKFEQVKDVNKTLPFLKKIGCPILVVSVLPPQLIRKGRKELEAFFLELNQLGKVYRSNGIQLAYHHHNYEAVEFDGIRGFELMDEVLNFEDVQLVCDTYWLQKSGYCPQHYLRAHSGKVIGLHLRDYEVVRRSYFPYGKDCAIGEGLLDFSQILQEAKAIGVQYCAVEQDSKLPFQDIEKSLHHLMTGGMKDAWIEKEKEW